MQIRGDRILLRNIEEKDIELLRQMINDKELNQMTVGESSYVSKIKQQIWFKNLKNEKNNSIYAHTPNSSLAYNKDLNGNTNKARILTRV